jgi:hypothetical protein
MARSRPRVWARSGSSQIVGFSSSRETSSSRSTFRSKSKKPPERGEALRQIGDLCADGIEFDHGDGDAGG